QAEDRIRDGHVTGVHPCALPLSGDPPYAGSQAGGYDVKVFPSINQIRQGAFLYRIEAQAELDGGGLVRTLVWKRADLTVRLVDQIGRASGRARCCLPGFTGIVRK